MARSFKSCTLYFRTILLLFRLFHSFAGSCPVQRQTYLWELSRSTRARIRVIAQRYHSWVNEDGANTAAHLCHPDLILYVHRLNLLARTGSFFYLPVVNLETSLQCIYDFINMRLWVNQNLLICFFLLLHICWSIPQLTSSVSNVQRKPLSAVYPIKICRSPWLNLHLSWPNTK